MLQPQQVCNEATLLMELINKRLMDHQINEKTSASLKSLAVSGTRVKC